MFNNLLRELKLFFFFRYDCNHLIKININVNNGRIRRNDEKKIWSRTELTRDYIKYRIIRNKLRWELLIIG